MSDLAMCFKSVQPPLQLLLLCFFVLLILVFFAHDDLLFGCFLLQLLDLHINFSLQPFDHVLADGFRPLLHTLLSVFKWSCHTFCFFVLMYF